MEESRNHSLFDKSNVSPAPTDGVPTGNFNKMPRASIKDSGAPTSIFKGSKGNLHEEDSALLRGEVQHQPLTLDMGPGGSFAL